MLIKSPFTPTVLNYPRIKKTKSIKNIHQHGYLCSIHRTVCSINEQAIQTLTKTKTSVVKINYTLCPIKLKSYVYFS